jgi:hypothetical protein
VTFTFLRLVLTFSMGFRSYINRFKEEAVAATWL